MAIVIGIDPGVATGLAVWNTDRQGLNRVECMTILQAMDLVRGIYASAPEEETVLVIFEDARKRTWFGHRADDKTAKYGAGVREGIGSVKRDCAIWEEFLETLGCPYEARYPHATKWKAEPFKKLTGWPARTNEHERDAAMIVYGLNGPHVKMKVLAWQSGHEDRAGRAGPADHRGQPRSSV